jgi:hypothetical protein
LKKYGEEMNPTQTMRKCQEKVFQYLLAFKSSENERDAAHKKQNYKSSNY